MGCQEVHEGAATRREYPEARVPERCGTLSGDATVGQIRRRDVVIMQPGPDGGAGRSSSARIVGV